MAEQHTTSFSIVDKFGNAIGVTPTLGGLFGNNVVVGNTGLLLNNGMRLGSTSPYPEHINYVGAGKVPILTNSPVVVVKDGRLAFVFGTLRMHRIMANFRPENRRSRALLQRLGFTEEGFAKDYLFIDGAWRDHVLTALVNPAYEDAWLVAR